MAGDHDIGITVATHRSDGRQGSIPPSRTLAIGPDRAQTTTMVGHSLTQQDLARDGMDLDEAKALYRFEGHYTIYATQFNGSSFPQQRPISREGVSGLRARYESEGIRDYAFPVDIVLERQEDNKAFRDLVHTAWLAARDECKKACEESGLPFREKEVTVAVADVIRVRYNLHLSSAVE